NKTFNDLEFRDELKNILRVEYPRQKEKLIQFSSNWPKEEKEQLKIIFNRIETLFKVYRNEIMDQLNSIEAYEDPNIYMMARLPFEDSEISIKTIYKNLNSLIDAKQQNASQEVEAMFSALNV